MYGQEGNDEIYGGNDNDYIDGGVGEINAGAYAPGGFAAQ
jgi:hypothetical protein